MSSSGTSASAGEEPPSDEGGLEHRGRPAGDADERGPIARAAALTVDWWRTRHRGTTPDERRVVIDRFLRDAGGIRTGRFWAMQAAAIVIATMGLSADSAAVVIGAMLVAPLMTPIMAVATAFALGWPLRALRPLVGVGLAAVGSIAFAWGLHSAIPGADVTDELLARTSPDVRDLLVALAAGAAGALATAREDVSAALPGVAVAVALVPPLATVGACLELGRTDLASGALLLFVTNLVAIVLAGIVVLLWSGFVPARLLERSRPVVAAAVAATLLALVAVGIPLTARTVAATEVAELNRSVTAAVLSWLDGSPEVDLTGLAVDGEQVLVDLTGPQEPTDVPGLTDRLRPLFDVEPVVNVRWSVRSTASDAPDADAVVIDEVRAVVDSWLTDETDLDVAAVSIGGGRVVVDLVGAVAPDTPDDLAQVVSERAVDGAEVEIRFSRRVTLGDVDEPVDPRAVLVDVATSWADPRGLTVDRVGLERDGEVVTSIVVDLSGAREPARVRVLADAILTAAGELEAVAEGPDLRIRFTQRSDLDWSDPPEPAASAPR